MTRRSAVFFWLLAACSVITTAVQYFAGDQRTWVANVACTAAGVFAVGGTFASRKTSRTWTFLLAACSFWLAGMLMWDLASIFEATQPFPSPIDVMWLAFPILAAIGLHRLAQAIPSMRRLARLDAFAVSAGVLTITFALIHASVEASTLPALGKAFAVAYPAAYIALVAVLTEAYFGARGAFRHPALVLVLFGVASQAVAFSAWAPDLLAQNYVQGTTIADALWPLGLLAIGAGGFLATVRPKLRQHHGDERQFRGILANCSLLALLGVLTVLVVLDRPRIELLILIGGLAIVGMLLFIRARLMLAERSRLLQDARVANDALLRINQELDAFAYTASHDLKAPLVSIDGLTASLERRLANDLDDRGRLYLSRIRANVSTLQRLIQDVLDYAWTGTTEAPATLDPLPIARELVEQVSGLARERGATVELVSPIPVLKAHPVRFKQALGNLIENAVRHAGNGRAVRVRVSGNADGNYARIVVEDDGVGVDPSTQPKMFDLFHKGPSGESGVGLALVKRIAESSGGAVRYEPVSGGGSRFVLDFPKGDAA
jgi:signal transduction histidine kinase